jgi:hypothetical protein
MLMWTMLGCAVVVLAFASGCGSRTVLVPEDSVIRVGPRVSGAIYYRVEGEWRESSQSIEYPEGWYLVPPSFVEESKEVSPS